MRIHSDLLGHPEIRGKLGINRKRLSCPWAMNSHGLWSRSMWTGGPKSCTTEVSGKIPTELIGSGFLLKGLVQSQVSKWKTSPKERLYISMYLHLWSCLFGFSSDQITPILIKSTHGLLCRTGTLVRFAAWMPGTDKDIDDVWEDTGLETEILQCICKLLSRHSCVSLFCLHWSTAAFENWHDLMNFGLSCYW